MIKLTDTINVRYKTTSHSNIKSNSIKSCIKLLFYDHSQKLVPAKIFPKDHFRYPGRHQHTADKRERESYVLKQHKVLKYASESKMQIILENVTVCYRTYFENTILFNVYKKK